MLLNDDLRDMVMANCSTDDLREKAKEYGMVTLRDSGFDKAEEGITTFDEVVRETVLEA